jgi:hypothetical protein
VTDHLLRSIGHSLRRSAGSSLWIALAIALVVQGPRTARADQPPSPAPPPGYPPPPPIYRPPAYAAPVSGPDEITEFDDSAPVPYGYTKVTRTRKGLIIAGSVTFGVSYGLSTLVAAIGEDLRSNGETSTDVSALFIPIAGPFVQATRSESATAKLYLLHLGAAQVAGAIMLYYGLTSPKTVLVRNDQLSIAPMVGNGTSGMMVTGRF